MYFVFPSQEYILVTGKGLFLLDDKSVTVTCDWVVWTGTDVTRIKNLVCSRKKII